MCDCQKCDRQEAALRQETRQTSWGLVTLWNLKFPLKNRGEPWSPFPWGGIYFCDPIPPQAPQFWDENQRGPSWSPEGWRSVWVQHDLPCRVVPAQSETQVRPHCVLGCWGFSNEHLRAGFYLLGLFHPGHGHPLPFLGSRFLLSRLGLDLWPPEALSALTEVHLLLH